MNQQEYLKMKRSVSGFYMKFNNKTLAHGIREIFNYNELLETAKNFKNFEEFYNYHTKDKEYLMNKIVEKMFEIDKDNIEGITKEKVKSCLVVRLGNIYNGKFMENKIISTFNNVQPWISCTETSVEIDINYKVDAIVTLNSIGNFAIQIKPLSFTKYDDGKELPFHKQFEIENNIKVYYVFYRDENTIYLNKDIASLYDFKKIEEIMCNIVL